MPELPDIELEKQYFEEHFLKKPVDSVEVLQPKILFKTTEKQLNEVLKGAKFTSLARRGKYLFAGTDKKSGLSLHFGMTGELKALEPEEKQPAYTRAVIYFKDGSALAYADRRLIGRIGVAKSIEEIIKVHTLGPDALEVSLSEFKERLQGKKGQIKPLLMDQSIIAGIGNVYADEILFQSHIHPLTKVADLDAGQLKELHKNIKPVLKTAIQHEGNRKELPKGYIIPKRKQGETCPRGNGKIEEITVGGRTTYYCPKCQVL